MKKLLPIVLGIALLATATPAFAHKDKNEDKGKGNSPVTFTTTTDGSKLKVLINKNIIKIQEIGRNRLKNAVNLKFKMHDGNSEVKVTVPKGTPTTNSDTFIAAVKKAYQDYKAAIKLARQNFMTAIQAARTAYITPTTTPTTTPNTAPTIATVATANPATVAGTTSTLSVLGADDTGESNLTYTWSTISKPAGAANPSFSINGTNAAKTTVATFGAAGSYQLQVVISDAGLLTTTSTVNVTVNQTLSSVTVSPASIALNMGSSTQLNASAFDQFNAAQPSTFSWSIFEGVLGGTISSAGLYTAPSATGTFHVIGTSTVNPARSATSTVTVN